MQGNIVRKHLVLEHHDAYCDAAVGEEAHHIKYREVAVQYFRREADADSGRLCQVEHFPLVHHLSFSLSMIVPSFSLFPPCLLRNKKDW